MVSSPSYSSTPTESEVLHRIHVLMEYTYNHDITGVFFVIQNMVFIREAE